MAARFVERHVRSYDREHARPAVLEYLRTHGESNYRIELSVQVSPGHRIVLWRDALPREVNGKSGIFQYYSPPSPQDGAQLVVETEEMPVQRLFVTGRIQHPHREDETLLEARLENTLLYRGGFNTELVRFFDDDTFKLHVYVPSDRVGKEYF